MSETYAEYCARFDREVELAAQRFTPPAAPKTCLYCDGSGNSDAGGACGFCVDGKPLDTQEDWNNSWGRALNES